MGKSTRSKVKRSYRAKKRQEGIFAATDAARLHRLSSKLKSVTAAKNVVENEEEMLAEGGDAQAEGAGWSLSENPSGLLLFGLVDPYDITPERMGRLSTHWAHPDSVVCNLHNNEHVVGEAGARAAQGPQYTVAGALSTCGLDHLMPGFTPDSVAEK